MSKIDFKIEQQIQNDFLQAMTHFKNKKYNEAENILIFIEELLEDQANKGKIISRHIIMATLYNLAHIYQKQGQYEKSIDYLDAVIENFDQLFMIEQKFVNLYWIYTQINLQKCALLSQLKKNNQALQTALYTYQYIKKNLQQLLYFIKQFNEDNQDQSQQDFVQFQQVIINNAQSQIQYIQELIEEFDKNQNLDIKQLQVYFWQQNPQNNEKHLRQQLNQTQSGHKSILGVLKKTQWLKNLNIGSILLLEPTDIEFFKGNQELYLQLNQKNLTLKIAQVSLCYFAISTENRYLKDLQISKIYHLKSIEIACYSIKEECPLVTHLIQVFQQYHNQNLEQIQEESLFNTPVQKKNTENQCQNNKTIKFKQNKEPIQVKPFNNKILNNFLKQNDKKKVPPLDMMKYFKNKSLGTRC